MPVTRAVRRLHHFSEAMCSELPQQSYHQYNQSSINERPSVKMKLVDIWNNKLQAQGECTSTRDGESKEQFGPAKTQSFLYSGTKWRDFRPEITYEMQGRTGTENQKWTFTLSSMRYYTQCHFWHLVFCW